VCGDAMIAGFGSVTAERQMRGPQGIAWLGWMVGDQHHRVHCWSSHLTRAELRFAQQAAEYIPATPKRINPTHEEHSQTEPRKYTADIASAPA
jgi:hypothetical protein